MITIHSNTDLFFTNIRSIAAEVWPAAYGSILSRKQLEYMLVMMYNVSSLQQQAENGHHFIVAVEDESPVGFASYEFNFGELSKTKIHKIYILPSNQRKGTGKMLINFITEEARRNNQQVLALNVNKYNDAQGFYKKIGFDTTHEEIIDIGHGYVMDDFIMEMKI